MYTSHKKPHHCFTLYICHSVRPSIQYIFSILKLDMHHPIPYIRPVFTFCVSRRRRKVNVLWSRTSVCVCVCLYVYLSAAACLHYCTDTDVTWRSGRGCPLVVHCWADLQSVHGLRCYGNTRNAWQSPAVIRQAHRTPHALRTPEKTPLTRDKIDAPAACATLSATTTRPLHFVHTARVL